MLDGKRRQSESAVLKQQTRLHLIQLDAHIGNLPWPKDNLHQRLHTRQGKRPAVDVQFLQRLPAPQRAGQPAQAQDVVEVTVGEQNLVEPAETQARAQQLALRAFAAVDHEAVLVGQHERRRKPALHRRGGGGCAEKDEFEHDGQCTGSVLFPANRLPLICIVAESTARQCQRSKQRIPVGKGSSGQRDPSGPCEDVMEPTSL